MFQCLLGPEPKRELQLQLPTQIRPVGGGIVLLHSQIFSWVKPLLCLAALNRHGMKRCFPLALLKARSLPKWDPGWEISYLLENRVFRIFDVGGKMARFRPCKPLFARNFCIFA
jgi:hypothetical protein